MIFRCIIASLALLCGASAIFAATAEWKLNDVIVEGPKDSRVLCLDATVTVHCDEEPEIKFTTFGTDRIPMSIEVRDSQGRKLEEVPTTGPAEAFIKDVVLKKGENRVFHRPQHPPAKLFLGTHDQQEIDLIEELNGRLAAIEIKYTKTKSPAPMAWKTAYPDVAYKTISRDNYLPFVTK